MNVLQEMIALVNVFRKSYAAYLLVDGANEKLF